MLLAFTWIPSELRRRTSRRIASPWCQKSLNFGPSFALPLLESLCTTYSTVWWPRPKIRPICWKLRCVWYDILILDLRSTGNMVTCSLHWLSQGWAREKDASKNCPRAPITIEKSGRIHSRQNKYYWDPRSDPWKFTQKSIRYPIGCSLYCTYSVC